MSTSYLVTTNGRVAQNTLANKVSLSVSSVIQNGGDNLLFALLSNIIGCQMFMARDLTKTVVVSFVPSLALNELQAARYQQAPVAVVPDGDPFVLVNGEPNTEKLNLYRVGVDQSTSDTSSTAYYCQKLVDVAPARLLLNEALLRGSDSPDPAAGNNMFTFLAVRFVESFNETGLNCTGMGMQSPVNVTQDSNFVAIDAHINLGAADTGSGGGGATGAPVGSGGGGATAAPVGSGGGGATTAPVGSGDGGATGAPVGSGGGSRVQTIAPTGSAPAPTSVVVGGTVGGVLGGGFMLASAAVLVSKLYSKRPSNFPKQGEVAIATVADNPVFAHYEKV